MRVRAVPENIVERVLDLFGIIPRPLMETFDSLILARCVMVATKSGVFDALAGGPKTAHEVATGCDMNPGATEKLLNALCGARYLRHIAPGRYGLASITRRWLLKTSKISLHDNLVMRFLEWDAIAYFEEFVRTGVPLEIHDTMERDQWAAYQRGMKSVAAIVAPEVARRIPLRKGATRMLDLGGSHGLYSVGLCRRHQGLSAVIYDLPEAIEHAAPLLAEENMGDRVVHHPANALTADLGENQWDLVFISQLLHHFSDEACQQVMQRVERALVPGGTVAIVELIKPDDPRQLSQTAAFFNIYFAATSRSGTRSAAEYETWMRDTGAINTKSMSMFTAPGVSIICGRKATA